MTESKWQQSSGSVGDKLIHVFNMMEFQRWSNGKELWKSVHIYCSSSIDRVLSCPQFEALRTGTCRRRFFEQGTQSVPGNFPGINHGRPAIGRCEFVSH